MSGPSVAELADGLHRRDRRSLAKAITLVESTRDVDRDAAIGLLEQLLEHTGGATRVGVSGPPGVGKSTFIEALGLHLVDQGRRVAVLAVDPSSRGSGGSILGDKTRMAELGRHPDAFIRPTPSRGDLGGVSRRTREVLLVCEAAGFDVVLVETVGVGQSEVAVADMVDTFLLLVASSAGDELQGVKRGIMELADVVAVTKADGDLEAAARRAEADHRQAVALLRRRHAGWEPRVLACSAFTGAGIGEVWEAVEAHRALLQRSGQLEAQRQGQAVSWFWDEVRAALMRPLEADPRLAELSRQAVADVAAGRVTAATGAQRVMAALVADRGRTG